MGGAASVGCMCAPAGHGTVGQEGAEAGNSSLRVRSVKLVFSKGCVLTLALRCLPLVSCQLGQTPHACYSNAARVLLLLLLHHALPPRLRALPPS